MPSNKPSLSSSVPSSPTPRSSEIVNPMRRSFTGNPFSKPSIVANAKSNFPNTPVNSPSDFPRRVRDSMESLRNINDDKENGKDQILKQTKVRTPAASSKSTKNFMSPTISASCKINESPRKKVLAERNEPAPPTSSVSSADPKIHIPKVTFAEPLEDVKFDALSDEEILRSSLTSEDFSCETLHDDVSDPLIPKHDAEYDDDVHDPLILENDIHTESIFETVAPDCVNLDPTFKLSPPAASPSVSSRATILAPLDADPLMPPYDPKKNYLSPRPQFLHYKPKPRMELNNERELEVSFISESFSDTEVTEDTQSEGSQKESEDDSLDESVKQGEEQIVEPRIKSEGTVKAKEVPKPGFSVRSKAIALILLLLVAFVSISVTNSPVIDHPMFEDFYDAYKLSEFSQIARANFDRVSQFVKANFDGLARNLHIWFTKSLSSISQLISNDGGVHNLGQLQYHDVVVNHYPMLGNGDAVSEIDTDVDAEDISEDYYEIYEENLQQDIGVVSGVESASDAPESEEVFKSQSTTMIESEQALQQAQAEDLEAKLALEIDASFDVENASDAPVSEEVENLEAVSMIESDQALQAENLEVDASFNVENQPRFSEAEIRTEVCGEGNVDMNLAQENDAKLNAKHWLDADSEDAEIHTTVYDKAEGKTVSMDSAVKGNEMQNLLKSIPQSMVLYFLLFAGTIFFVGAAFKRWSRKGLRIKENEENINFVGESCPSEMSSYQAISSYSKSAMKQSNEDHKVKCKNIHRRESLASSSSDSIGSYGSLTVYEKIPTKHGQRDEAITPVRRSSRIRNSATSLA